MSVQPNQINRSDNETNRLHTYTPEPIPPIYTVKHTTDSKQINGVTQHNINTITTSYECIC